MRTVVALDLETTGLDPGRDAVIEVGAVRFRGPRAEGEWHSLINPGRPVPSFITQLTGITDDMLAAAPRLAQVLAELADFVGESPLLGHNVAFDIGFLSRKGLFEFNSTLDTYDLASVMLPSAGAYNLSALASALGIPVNRAHRALDDAHTTRSVFLRLYEECLELPMDLIEEIVRYGEEVEWGAGWIFDEVFREKSEAGRPQRPEAWSNEKQEARPALVGAAEPLRPGQARTPLDSELLATLVEPGGVLARKLEGFEHRPQQVTMLRAVADAFSKGQHLLVEAGTGTGKSMAYLIPALAWASSNGERVIISTNTINLQDQLIRKDIPDLQAALGTEYRASVLKGRNNYLCPRRLNALRQLGPRSAEELRVLAKVLVWLARGGTGDKGEISLLGAVEAAAWSRLSAESEDCSSDACQHFAGGSCPYFRARREAETAHVIIVNHALLLADVVTGNRVLPEYRYLVIDEAHHLEEATTKGLSFQVTEHEIARILKDVGSGSGGLLGRVLAWARHDLPPDQSPDVQRRLAALSDAVNQSALGARGLFAEIARFLAGRREGRPVGPYGQQERILPSTRTLEGWSSVETSWEELREPLGHVAQSLLRMGDEMGGLAESADDPKESLGLALASTARDLALVRENLDQLIFEAKPQIIYWIELQSDQARISLHAAPLEVGSLVERFLWNEKEAVVMTSATLTTAGSFDYLRQRLNAHEANELPLGSPFDFESSTLLYLVDDIPEPNNAVAYQKALERGIVALCTATRGRALVLFTSTEHMRRTAGAIEGPLAGKGILVFEQGGGASRHSLLETFRNTDQAVLLGTRSFWEGVDVPGEALSALAIVRLPFDVPSDPIIAARAETYESPFAEYSVPEAILRFRQGFGRLIRTRSDRGIVVTLDRRILSKSYGRAFLDSLPHCTVRSGPLAELPRAAARWLGA